MPITTRRTRLAAALLFLAACGSEATGPGDQPGPGVVPVFTSHLTDLSRIVRIVPPGSVAGDEIKPHGYLFSDGNGPVPVYAPVDMVLTSATWVGAWNDFGFQFDINSRFRLRLGHITHPRADIAALVPRTDPSSLFDEVGPVAFKAGDLIGHTAGVAPTNGFDFGVYDLQTDINTPSAARYRRDHLWTSLNSVCGYSYFDAGLRGGYYAKFASIGGIMVPGAPCRSNEDVVSGGGLAGEWVLTSHAPSGNYQRQFAVGISLDRGTVRVAGLGGIIDQAGAADPQSIHTEACYSGHGNFIYLRLSTPTTLDVVAEPGDCPATFPAGNHRTYGR